MPTSPEYLFDPDESYQVNLPFEEIKDLIKQKSAEEDYPLGKSMLLLIETSEGVFLRSKSSEWCEYFTSLAYGSLPALPVRILEKGEWDALTRKIKVPLNSFGDEGLAMWRVGF